MRLTVEEITGRWVRGEQEPWVPDERGYLGDAHARHLARVHGAGATGLVTADIVHPAGQA